MGLFFTGIGACAALVLAILGLYQWLKSRDILQAELRRHTFVFPSELNQLLAKLIENGTFELQRLRADYSQDESLVEVIDIFLELYDNVWKYDLWRDLVAINVIEVELCNRGNEELKNVELKSYGAIAIEKYDGERYVSVDSENAPINIRPREKFKYRVWQKRLFDEIDVLQAKGHVRLTEYELVKKSAIRNLKLFRFWAFIIIMSIMWIIIFYLSIGHHK